MASKDSFDREIDYLRVSITDRCNLRCIYCMPEAGSEYFSSSEVLNAEQLQRIVRIAFRHGVRKVRLTGGEPLLRPDILEIVRMIKDVGINDLSITTNGVMLEKMALALKTAGVSRINISLDTLRPERYSLMTRGGDITRIWRAIESAEEAGISPIKINVVPVRGLNDDEVTDFAQITMQKDWHIRFIELMPVGHKKNWNPKSCVKKNELIEKISTLGRLNMIEFRGKGPSRNYQLEGAKGIIGFISPVSDCFCKWCNRLRLTANGRLRPCLFSDKEIDIITPLKNGATDSQLDKIFQQAIRTKPIGHNINEDEFSPPKSMSKIGG